MANLLQKASIVLTPTAYDNGKVLCAKPSEPPYGDFDFSRNSAATRVNAQGLVENVQILSSNLVQNGDFSEEGVQEISNGSFSQEGSEQIVNGDFSSNTDWSFIGDTIIQNGVAEFPTSTNSFLIQSNVVALSVKTYKLQYEVITTNGNNFRLAGGNSAFGTVALDSATIGVKTIYIVSNGTNVNLQFNNDNFIGSIDNVSVREVGQDWTFSSGAYLTALGARITHTPTTGTITSAGYTPLVIGNNYKMTYEITEYISGGVKINSAVDVTMVSTVGIHTKYFEADSTFVQFSRTNTIGNDVTITNISIKEVGQNWTLRTGFSIAENKVVAGSLSNGADIRQFGIFQQSKKYKISIDADKISGTNIILRTYNGSFQTIGDLTENSSFIYTTTATNNGTLYIVSNNFTGSITNISVIEITDDTNLPRINYEGFSYDGSGNVVPDSGCGSWLFEPQSTNLITQSEDFSGWSKFNSTYTANQGVSPDGTTTMDLITYSSVGGSLYKTMPTIIGTTYTFSLYMATQSGTIDINIGNINAGVYETKTVTTIPTRFSITQVASANNRLAAIESLGIYSVLVWGA